MTSATCRDSANTVDPSQDIQVHLLGTYHDHHRIISEFRSLMRHLPKKKSNAFVVVQLCKLDGATHTQRQGVKHMGVGTRGEAAKNSSPKVGITNSNNRGEEKQDKKSAHRRNNRTLHHRSISIRA